MSKKKTHFYGFKKRINNKLEGVNSKDLVGIGEKLASLYDTLKDMSSRKFPIFLDRTIPMI